MRAARAAATAVAARMARGAALTMKTILLTKTMRQVGAVAVVVGGREVAKMTGPCLHVFQGMHLPALLDVATITVVVGGRDVAAITGPFLNVFQWMHLPALLDVVVPVVQKL